MSYSKMTVSDARKSRGFGYLTEAGMEHQRGYGWYVWVKGGSHTAQLVDARTKSVRYFLTLDAAVGVLRDIGFPVEGLQVL